MLKKLEAAKAYINKHVAMLIVIMGALLTSTLFILIRSTNLYIIWLTMTILFIIFNIRTVIYIKTGIISEGSDDCSYHGEMLLTSILYVMLIISIPIHLMVVESNLDKAKARVILEVPISKRVECLIKIQQESESFGELLLLQRL